MCVFGVDSSRMFGFIVSNKGIQVDPLKIEAIVNLPPPHSIKKIRSWKEILTFFNVLS